MRLEPDDHISTYFVLGEAIVSQTADRLGFDNYPDDVTLARIVLTARKMDSIRRFLGAPIVVTSWYRCPALNAAIGSKPTSQHIRGEAVDFRCPQFGRPAQVFKAIREGGLIVDQIILEFSTAPSGGWVHVSFSENPRQQALMIDEHGTRAVA